MREKVEAAIALIREYEPADGYYEAFSGGKDSAVTDSLLRLAGVKFDAHYNVTTVDPAPVLPFIRENYPHVSIERAPDSMFRLIARKGMLPTSRSRWCCDVLKERGGESRFVVMGIRREEGESRRQRLEVCSFKGKRILNPIIDWSTEDVWRFIDEYGVKYLSLYDVEPGDHLGVKRVGCICCPKSRRQMAPEARRYPRTAAAYVKACEKAIAKREADGKPSRFDSGLEMFLWWIDPGDYLEIPALVGSSFARLRVVGRYTRRPTPGEIIEAYDADLKTRRFGTILEPLRLLVEMADEETFILREAS